MTEVSGRREATIYHRVAAVDDAYTAPMEAFGRRGARRRSVRP